MEKISLSDFCDITTGDKNNHVVGVDICRNLKNNLREDSSFRIVRVNFPIGYKKPESDVELRKDIFNLIDLIRKFKNPYEKCLLCPEKRENEIGIPSKNVLASLNGLDFLFLSYCEIIEHFLKTRKYYSDLIFGYKSDVKGKISWKRTFRRKVGNILKNGSVIYTNFTTRCSFLDDAGEISEIHRYCVNESFSALGWLYLPFFPVNSRRELTVSQRREWTDLLDKKIKSSNRDEELMLFRAMRNVLNNVDHYYSEKGISLVTHRFDQIWECIVNEAFGSGNNVLEEYYPKSRWLIKRPSDAGNFPVDNFKVQGRENERLRPDVVIENIEGRECYLLDAKYYRYGSTLDTNHLPTAVDLYKQITYGEYAIHILGGKIEMKIDTNADKNEEPSVLSAFVMPFASSGGHGEADDVIRCVGSSQCDWRQENDELGKIRLILVDTRFLINNYLNISDDFKQKLVKCIKDGISKQEQIHS